MNFLRSSSSNGRLRLNVARPRFSSTSHSNSLMSVPPEIEVTGSGFGRSMSGLMGGWSRQLRSAATGTAAPPKTVFRNFLPRFYSGAARGPDHHLRRSINREYLRSVITSEEGDDIPVGSRFQLEDVALSSDGRSQRITFTKTYNGEHTFVQVFVFEENSALSCDLMYVASKKPDRQLAFFIHPPFDSELRIGQLVLLPSQDHMKQLTPEAIEDLLENYDFSELDENLQDGFDKYLAVRGVTIDWWRKVAPFCLMKQTATFQNQPLAASRPAPNTDILRSIIDSEPPEVCGIPVGSPFEIVDISAGERSVTYSKKYKGEWVNVWVYLDPEDDENSGNSVSDGTEWGVTIVKPNKEVLLFIIRTFDSEITIEKLNLGNPKGVDGRLYYKFSDLDEELQGAFYKYLAMRGITADWWRDTCVHGDLPSLLKGVIPPELRNPYWPFKQGKDY